jgi:hypothetical protein
METIRAKFKCENSEPIEGDQTKCRLTAVTSGSEENKSFSRWTPNGTIELVISNETQAANFLQVGKEYYIDFALAE